MQRPNKHGRPWRYESHREENTHLRDIQYRIILQVRIPYTQQRLQFESS